MPSQAPHLQILTGRGARRLGAMFRPDLDGQVLVFSYPHAAERIFHTFFCPELRIVALGNDGQALSNTIVPPNRLHRLPKTRIVIECSPVQPLTRADLVAIAAAIPGQPRPPQKGT